MAPEVKPRPEKPFRWDDLGDNLSPQDVYNALPQCGEAKVYALLDSKAIWNIRVGQKYLITKQALRDYCAGLPNRADAGTPLGDQ
jgi:hypothetical protein